MCNTNKVLITALIFCVCIYSKLFAQNLVPNPSFESLYNCPTGDSQLSYAIGWNNPTLGTPDLFNECLGASCPNLPSVCVPENWQGYQYPRTGSGYAGIFTYFAGPNLREYVQMQLSSPLVAGQEYIISFYASLGDNSVYAIDNLGAHISSTFIFTGNSNNISCCLPQIMSDGFITDKNGWTLIYGCYTATGGEEYITIGNFKNDNQTNVQVLSGSLSSSFYYIDDVSVELVSSSSIGDVSADLGPDTTLCEGESLLLDASIPWSAYDWQDNTIASTQSVTQSGTYWVTVTNQCAVTTDTVQVTFAPSPNVDLGVDTTLCTGDTLPLDVTNINANYIWQDGSTNNGFTVGQAGSYWVDVTIGNCEMSDTINVGYIDPLVLDLGEDTTLCPDNSISMDAFNLGANYIWSDGSTNSTVTISDSGTYWANVYNTCESIFDTIRVNYYPELDLITNSEIIGCSNDTIKINALETNGSYLWSNGDTTNYLFVQDPGTYLLNLELNGCEYHDTIYVYLEECETIIQMPNVFTPNNDGLNDYFLPIEVLGEPEGVDFIIVNRWGNVVFESNELNSGWDGKTNNKLCAEGTYFWIVRCSNCKSEKPLQGSVTLVR